MKKTKNSKGYPIFGSYFVCNGVDKFGYKIGGSIEQTLSRKLNVASYTIRFLISSDGYKVETLSPIETQFPNDPNQQTCIFNYCQPFETIRSYSTRNSLLIESVSTNFHGVREKSDSFIRLQDNPDGQLKIDFSDPVRGSESLSCEWVRDEDTMYSKVRYY